MVCGGIKISTTNFQKPLDKLLKVWYNIITVKTKGNKKNESDWNYTQNR